MIAWYVIYKNGVSIYAVSTLKQANVLVQSVVDGNSSFTIKQFKVAIN